MAFSNPLVIDYDAGTKSLVKVNQDSYGSEYLLREATQEFRIKIRHTKESPTSGGRRMDRHNVELTRTVYGAAGEPDLVQQAYVVFRHDYRDDATDASLLGEALSSLLVAGAYLDLSSWQS